MKKHIKTTVMVFKQQSKVTKYMLVHVRKTDLFTSYSK